MIEKAYAKINLCLDVKSRREDGYHELDMIMAPLDFYDQLTFNIAEEMSIECNVPYLVFNEKNTIIKAIHVLREEFGFNENFKITLKKHIPTQAGLAGGSADAAATMRAIKKLLKLDISEKKMIELAKKVGADVPFCLKSKVARVQGIGEDLDYFKFRSDFFVFLVKPFRGISTKEAFELLDIETAPHPDVLKLKKSLIQENYNEFTQCLENSLEQSAFKLLPQIEEIKKALIEFGFDGALMSGSGSTVFAITRDEALVDSATKVFKKKKYFVRKTRILSN